MNILDPRGGSSLKLYVCIVGKKKKKKNVYSVSCFVYEVEESGWMDDWNNALSSLSLSLSLSLSFS